MTKYLLPALLALVALPAHAQMRPLPPEENVRRQYQIDLANCGDNKLCQELAHQDFVKRLGAVSNLPPEEEGKDEKF